MREIRPLLAYGITVVGEGKPFLLDDDLKIAAVPLLHRAFLC
jgi:hypothetical protein